MSTELTLDHLKYSYYLRTTISEQAIFKAKGSLLCWRNINIFFNEQFSVLAVACLCSYYSVQNIRVRGIKLDGKEAQFQSKTFPRLGNGRIILDIGSAGGEYFFNAVNILSDFDLFEDF